MLGRFFLSCYLAITDFEFYPKVWQQPLRTTSTFLLYLAAAVSVCLTTIYAWHLHPEVERFFAWAQTSMPPFSVVNGRLRVEANQPLVLKYRDSLTWTFVFDTTGTYPDAQGLEQPAVLFASDSLSLHFQGTTESYSWSDLGSFELRPEHLSDYKRMIRWIYFPLAYSTFFIFTLIAKPVQALLLSPLSLIVGSSYGIRLPLRSAFTIAQYSLVPAIVIDVAVKATGLNISYFDLIYLATAGIYTYFATQRCMVIQT